MKIFWPVSHLHYMIHLVLLLLILLLLWLLLQMMKVRMKIHLRLLNLLQHQLHSDWDAAMNEEYHSLLANNTWDLVPLPKGRKLIRCKWVYRTKYGPDGSIDKHKARLVAKGFSQIEGIDYTETFAPVAKMNSIRLVLALQPLFVGKSIRWMSNPPSCMGICKKKSTWNNLLVSFSLTLALFVALRNLSMALSKPLGLGMLKWIDFL